MGKRTGLISVKAAHSPTILWYIICTCNKSYRNASESVLVPRNNSNKWK
jgi:hypothetical protein